MPRRTARQEVAALTLSVARPVGWVLMILAAAMALAAALGAAFSGSLVGVLPLCFSALLSATAGFLLVRFAPGRPNLGRREALLMVAASWLAAAVIGSLPFLVGSSMGPVDSFFEATSGITTTGASVLGDIEGTLSPPLQIWRTMMHWLGGLGLVVLFVAIFPTLGVGGRHLFQFEAPGPRHEGLVPRIKDTSRVLWRIYVLLTVILTLILLLLGLSPLDALSHAFSTMATGGFSPKNDSVGGLGSIWAEMVILVFMLVAGTNFGLFYMARKHGPRVFLRNVEFKVYIGLFVVASLLVSIDIISLKGSFLEALRHGAFHVASLMTTTGFVLDDFDKWPSVARLTLGALYFGGGSSGSTAGGMKLIRIIILVSVVLVEVKRAHRPNLVTPVRVGDRIFSPEAVMEVAGFLFMWLMTALAGALLVALIEDTDLVTAGMASVACVSNVGPAFGGVGPTENYGTFTAITKVILSFSMLLGRIEFLAFLVLLNPRFWRR